MLSLRVSRIVMALMKEKKIEDLFSMGQAGQNVVVFVTLFISGIQQNAQTCEVNSNDEVIS